MIGGTLARNPRDSRRFIVPSGKVGVSRFRVMERGQSRGTYLRGTIIIRGSSAENDAFVAQNRAVRARQFCKLSPGRRGSNSLSRPCSPVVFPTMLLFAIFSLHFSLRVSPLFPRFPPTREFVSSSGRWRTTIKRVLSTCSTPT